jgi:hypothetical protein
LNAMSGTSSNTPLPVGLLDDPARARQIASKKEALDKLLEKTRAEFMASYDEDEHTQRVTDSAREEVIMTKHFDGLSVGPATSDPGDSSASVATVRSADADEKPGEGVVVPAVPVHKNNRTCSMCGYVGHWRKMRREMKIDRWQEFKHEPEDTYYEVQTCMKCVGVEMGIPEKEAQAIVLAGPIAHKKARYENMMEGKAMAAAKISGMSSCSRTERRELTMDTMIELFGPLAKHIVRKHQALQRVHTDTLRHAELAAKLAECSDFESEREILTEMEGL